MKELIKALRKMRKRHWLVSPVVYIMSHEDVLKIAGVIAPRVNKYRCLECGGKVHPFSPMWYKHKKNCKGVARYNAFFEAIGEFKA